MNNKFKNNIRVFIVSQVSKECSYFASSSKDSLKRVVVSKQAKQAFFGRRSAFPVLKSCRILRRTNNDTDKNNNFDTEQKMDPIDKMMSDINQDAIANLPSTETTMEALSVPLLKMMTMLLSKLATPTLQSKDGCLIISNYY
jgi:hypothetical protein